MTAAATKQKPASGSPATPVKARELMEQLNADAGKLNIWVRTELNAPAQRAWFSDTGGGSGLGKLATGRVAANQIKTLPCRWRWKDYGPFLERIEAIARRADVSPIEFADRQSILLTNPGLGGRLQVTTTMRTAISIYTPGDVAPAHIHSANASRTILSERGGYTNVEGERCEAVRGDLIVTPNGTWHDHGNDSSTPVIWIDMLDWPLMEVLDAPGSIWITAAPERRATRRYKRRFIPTAIPAACTDTAVSSRPSCPISAAGDRIPTP